MKRLLTCVLLCAPLHVALADTAPTTPPAAPTPTAAPAKTAAATGPGTAAVKQANETISKLLGQKVKAGSPEEKELAKKVTTSVRSFIDLDELGKRALADNVKKFSKAQLDEFLGTLRALIEDNYVRGVRANVAYTVDYTGETTKKQGNPPEEVVEVKTVINSKRKNKTVTIGVDYILVKQGDQLRAIDIITDDVSLVLNYRTMFGKIISKDGVDALIAKMKKKQLEAK